MKILHCLCFFQQFGPFDRQGQPLREDNVTTPTATKTKSTCTAASNPTTKTEMKETNRLTMDDFWNMIFPSTSP